MRLGITLGVAAGIAVGTAMLAPTEAKACGGCFPPPGDQQSVVTDHRMILSVSKEQSTLWDEIEYSGSPEQFAWVLPIAGTVDVGLSADTLFGSLHNLTATVVQAPPTNCPPPPRCPYDDEKNSAFGGASDAAPAPGEVDVIKQEFVGPYETVQLQSTNPTALTDWLNTNGFAVPADIEPVISAYVAEHFDFLALKLVPGQGVQAMRPVRITTQGANVALPLRMVAAGTGPTVGITLWVLGEGRYEPQNFASFALKSEDLTWDWATGTSDYKELRAQKTAELGGAGWEIESSIHIDRYQLESIVQRIGQVQGSSAGSDYAPVEDSGGNVTKTADQVREEDLATLWSGIADGNERVTRMRADLARSALATDLLVSASSDQSTLQNVRVPTKEKNEPQCPVYSGCQQVGTAPRSQAEEQSKANGSGETFGCDTDGRRHDGSGAAMFGGLAAFLGIALARSRRARKVADRA
jgi:hypothetical protein